MRRLALCAFAYVFLRVTTASAQITEEPVPVFPDPKKYAHGLYAEGNVGTVVFTGQTGGRLSPGFAIATRVGYEFWHWLAVQAYAAGSTHRGNFPGQPQDAELVQLYRVGGELKLTLTWRQISIFVYGGAGFTRQSTNLLAVAGLTTSQNSPAFGGGGGLDWHTLNRHYSFGLSADYMVLPGIASTGAVAAQLYLRYTF